MSVVQVVSHARFCSANPTVLFCVLVDADFGKPSDAGSLLEIAPLLPEGRRQGEFMSL